MTDPTPPPAPAEPLTVAFVDTWAANLSNTVYFGAEAIRAALRGEPLVLPGVGGPVVVTWDVLRTLIARLAAEIDAAVADLQGKGDPFELPPEMRGVAGAMAPTTASDGTRR
jgi:hypothetical protein